jgi:hypothetical protein
VTVSTSQSGHRSEAEPQRGSERLADSADRHHSVRGEALQRADRLTVVPEFGVVIVLGQYRPSVASPGNQLTASLRRQHRPGRPMVRRGDDDGLDIGGGDGLDVDAAVVDPNRHRRYVAQPGGFLDRTVIAGILEGDSADSPVGQRTQQQAQTLCEASTDDDLPRADVGCPDPPEIAGQHRPQLRGSGRVAVADRRRRRLPQRLPLSPKPIGAREAGQIRQAGHEVHLEPRRCPRETRRQGGQGWPGGRRSGNGRGDPGRRADLALQIPLTVQLLVALGNQPSGHAECTSQLPARRQPLPRLQPATADRLPQPLLQLGPQGSRS